MLKNVNKNQINKFLILCLLALLIILPKAIFFSNGVSDPHIYSSIVPAQISLNEERIIFNPCKENKAFTLNAHTNGQSDRLGITSSQVIFSIICGFNLKELQFIPINSLILGLLAYVIAKKIFKKNFYSFAIIIFLMYEPIIGYLTNTTSEHSYGYVLYFTSIIIFLNIYNSNGFKYGGIPIFIILFISSLLTYYTVEFYILLYSIIFYIIVYLAIKLKNFNIFCLDCFNNYRLSLILIIIFLTYDKIVYNYISKQGLVNTLGKESIFYYISDFLYTIFNKLVRIAPDTDMTQSFPSINILNSSVVWIGYFLYLFLLIPIIIYLLKCCWNLLKTKTISISLQTLFFSSIILTGLADIMIYLFLGIVSFKYILLAFPFLTFYSIDRIIKHTKIKKIAVLIIVSLCIIKFGVYLYSDQFPNRSYQITDPNTKWFVENGKPNCNVLTDLELGGKILIESAFGKVNVNVFGFRYIEKDNENVMFLYTNNVSKANELFKSRKYHYLFLSKKNINKPITGMIWKSFLPLGNNINNINKYFIFNKIYEDNFVFIYKFSPRTYIS